MSYKQLDNTLYLVVVNHEEQYSIWPEDKAIPTGWQAEGTKGKKQDCLAYIQTIWMTITPASLRVHMGQTA
ncbi:MAG: MbtH family protein [Methylococcaceae bacterium]|jgi:MbtH protein